MPPVAWDQQKGYLNEGLASHLRVQQESELPNFVPEGTQHFSLNPREGGGIPPSPPPSPREPALASGGSTQVETV